MKIGLKVGDKVKVLTGKCAGKEAAIVAIDKKTARVKLDGLKKSKVKTKKGDSKELHGTFYARNLELIKEEPAPAPAEQEAAQEA